MDELNLQNNRLHSLPTEILNIKQNININEISYEINNLDIECTLLILRELQINIGNLPINIKEVLLNDRIKNSYLKNYLLNVK